MTALEILQALVGIPSESARSNQPLVEWVCQRLEPLGWQCERLPYHDAAGLEKLNLLARPPRASAGIELGFLCHTDTVPSAVGWETACQLASDGTVARGLGACDVKGALAAFLAAVMQGPQQVIAPGVALLLTADEEIGCKGMEQLLAARPELRMQRAIVSEPTSLRPAVAGKGYGLARVTVRGREAHSAFPAEGRSAIAAAAALLLRVLDGANDALPGLPPLLQDSLFEPATTSFNVGTITGGTAKNMIPGECSFLVEWRAVPAQPTGTVPERLRTLLQSMEPSLPGTTMALELLRDEPGFAPAAQDELATRLSGITGRARTGISFGSEATRVARIAGEVVVIGPGDMHTAHSDRECIPLAELDEWTHTLAGLIRSGF